MVEERPKLKNPKLRQTLYGFQVFFIVLSAIIGGGIFTNNGEALELAGPAGLLLSVGVIGLIAICVSECISELVQQFPVYNAIVEYVRVFVDDELGWVVGLEYWYSFASVFAVQNLAGAALSQYWGLPQTWQTLAFYLFAPIAIIVLNLMGVFYYGIVETIGGFLKICLLLGISIFLYVIAAKRGLGGSDGPINEGFQNDPNFISDHSKATCYAIPLVAYCFLGIEIIAVTAFEARDASAVRWPSRWISYVVVILYILCTIGETLNVDWRDPHLPFIYGGVGNSTTAQIPSNPPSVNMVVNAAYHAGYRNLAGFLNGCLIFSVLSASNTSLYVSSRTLYGMVREMPNSNWLYNKIRWMAKVPKRTGVPAVAILVSAVSFYWLPFLQLKKGYALQDLIEIIGVSASVACLIVWMSLCLAFIRYHAWLRKCDNGLAGKPEFRRDHDEYRPTTLLDWLQPLVAWIGLVGCILVFGFVSATWWDTKVSFAKVAVAYGAHVVLLTLFILFKLINGKLFKPWGVHLNPDAAVLIRELNRLNLRKIDKKDSQRSKTKHRLWLILKRGGKGRGRTKKDGQADSDAHESGNGMVGGGVVLETREEFNHQPPAVMSGGCVTDFHGDGDHD